MDEELEMLTTTIFNRLVGDQDFRYTYYKTNTFERFSDNNSNYKLDKTSMYIAVEDHPYLTNTKELYLVEDIAREGQPIKLRLCMKDGFLIVDAFMNGDKKNMGLEKTLIFNKNGRYAAVNEVTYIPEDVPAFLDMTKYDFRYKVSKSNPNIINKHCQIHRFIHYDVFDIADGLFTRFLNI